MIEYIQHIPSYVEGFEPEIKKFKTLEELLEYKKKWLEDNDRKLVFARSDSRTLMVSSTTDKWWWVLGYVKGIDLTKYLPYYETTYKLQGKVEIVKEKNKSSVNGVELEEEMVIKYNSSKTDFALWSLKTKCWHAWNSINDYEFVRYATQEEIDEYNNYYNQR